MNLVQLKCTSCGHSLELSDRMVEVTKGGAKLITDVYACNYCGHVYRRDDVLPNSTGDQINVGDIIGSTGVAIGRGARASVGEPIRTVVCPYCDEEVEVRLSELMSTCERGQRAPGVATFYVWRSEPIRPSPFEGCPHCDTEFQEGDILVVV